MGAARRAFHGNKKGTVTRGVPVGQFESPAPNRRVLMRIDHNGEVLIGCIVAGVDPAAAMKR